MTPPVTTRDAFLGGKVHAHQPSKGFRSGVDAVLLAASVPAKPGDTLLEIGCGVGVAALCVAARVGNLAITGIELQSQYADLARQNAQANNAHLTVVTTDLRSLPDDLRQTQFNHVMMNPPYFDRTQGRPADDTGRDTAMAGDTPLGDWLDTGIRRLAPKGTLTVIQHITRLPEVLAGLHGRLGSVVVMPIAGRAGSDPNLFLAQAIHSKNAPFQMAPTLVMHAQDSATDSRESYTPQVSAILRHGADLPLRG